MKNLFLKILVVALIVLQVNYTFAESISVKYLSEYKDIWVTYSQEDTKEFKDIYNNFRFDLTQCYIDEVSHKWMYKQSYTGKPVNGWKYMTLNNFSGWYYFDNGKMLVNTWFHDTTSGATVDKVGRNELYSNDIWYYFNDYGILVENGWQNINGDYYYFAKTDDDINMNRGRSLRNCVIKDENMYYLNENGILVTNTRVRVDSQEYEADDRGILNLVKDIKVSGMINTK
ncbi:MAG: hypothetical protein IJ094_13025 [Bacilli bacterium]|nr:hypothetical protein [Bacilli bacterium]